MGKLKKKQKSEKQSEIDIAPKDDYPFKDLMSFAKNIKKHKAKLVIMIDGIHVIKRKFLKMAVHNITGRPVAGYQPKQKKTWRTETVCKGSTEKALKCCKNCNDNLLWRLTGAATTMKPNDLARAFCRTLLQHDWSQAIRCLYHLLPYQRLRTTLKDSTVRSLLLLILNHPNRTADLLEAFMSSAVRKDDSSLDEYISSLLLLPEKLDTPTALNPSNSSTNITNVLSFLRETRKVKYNDSNSE